jgi:hypothetical protein
MCYKKIGKYKTLYKNNFAVIGLPLRLITSLIIGFAALSFILFFILNPCLFPGKIIVNIEPMLHIIPPGFNEYNFSIDVEVTDVDGYAIKNASIMIKGLGDAVSVTSDSNGKASLEIKPRLEQGVFEGYLDVVVRAGCKKGFSEEKMIKIVRGS